MLLHLPDVWAEQESVTRSSCPMACCDPPGQCALRHARDIRRAASTLYSHRWISLHDSQDPAAAHTPIGIFARGLKQGESGLTTTPAPPGICWAGGAEALKLLLHHTCQAGSLAPRVPGQLLIDAPDNLAAGAAGVPPARRISEGAASEERLHLLAGLLGRRPLPIPGRACSPATEPYPLKHQITSNSAEAPRLFDRLKDGDDVRGVRRSAFSALTRSSTVAA